MMNRICVYCGSNPGRSASYEAAAKQLAATLVQQGIGLVYGGASVGIMGILADEMLTQGGEVIGVIPRLLVDKEVAHPGLTELKIVQSMHQRKAQMAELADGFIALPGGLGTLEELFEMLTWSVLGLHSKPCALLNVDGYYDLLCAFLEHARAEQFVKPEHHTMLLSANDAPTLVAQMTGYRAPVCVRPGDAEAR